MSRPFAVSAPVPYHTTSTAVDFIPALLFSVWACGLAVTVLFWLRCWNRTRAVRQAAIALPLDLPIPAMSCPSSVEPGVFGIRRPVLLLPEGIAERLAPAQLDAIVAHEMCHVRRRDNLTGAVHLIVETVFWFHPLVWWIRTRLLEERERACDEAVLESGSEARTYAEGIGDIRSPSMILPGGRFTATNNTVRELILNAYGISASPYLLEGGPGWIDSARYDIDAKAGANVIPAGTSNRVLWEKTRLMLQSLLADRFQVSIHRQTKEMPAYQLVVAKYGPKLQKTVRDCDATVTACHGFSGNPTRLSGSGVDMYDLALTLSSYSDRPVLDRTGVQGLSEKPDRFRVTPTPSTLFWTGPTPAIAPFRRPAASMCS